MSEPIRLFISYSHKDEAWLLRLKDVLKPLTRNGSLDPWDDKRIAAGDDWRDKIDQALESAHAAILLVSTSFLASDFINDVEMTKLLKRRVQGMGFFWIPITDTLYEETALEGIQAAWDPKKPLALIQNPAEQDGALVEIARKIKPLLNISKEEYRASRAEESGGPPDLRDSTSGTIGNSRPAEVKETAQAEIKSEPTDTDLSLVALIDRQVQEAPIQERSLSPTGPTLFVIPGPEAQKPGLFIERLRNHTCNGLLQELKKANRSLIHADVEWPSFPPSAAGSAEAIDMRLKRVVSEFKTRAQLNVDNVFGEALDVYAARVFKALRDTNPATLHVFVLQLVSPKSSPGECQGLARLKDLWAKFCAENAPSNVLIVFVASASQAEFLACHGASFADLKHIVVVEEMPNILYNDIHTWLCDNRLSARFNTVEIDKRARAVVGPERHEGVQMSVVADEAARWLSENRK